VQGKFQDWAMMTFFCPQIAFFGKTGGIFPDHNGFWAREKARI
jgi:hypothetical protein